jgi:transcriptional regulator with XRE-family HTH domain
MERKINTMVSSTLGDRIERARRAKGFDQPQLARRIAVKTKTLQNWESDRSEPRPEKLTKLAGMLDAEPRPEKLTKLAGMLDAPLVWLLTGETPEASRPIVSNSGMDPIARKLERAVSMQQDLAGLLIEVSADVARLRRDMADETDLAA